tara:strand:- start:2242 stop:3000 length:759 start_codon:yes stop_codon:yes gene_type:complete
MLYHIQIILIFYIGIIYPSQVLSKLSISNEHNLSKSKDNMFSISIESEEDIYGVQFDLVYNDQEIIINEDAIKSTNSNNNIYSKTIQLGIIRIIMFSLSGDMIFNKNINKTQNVINISFNSKNEHQGKSNLSFSNITMAGKGGMEISNTAIPYDIDVKIPSKSLIEKNYPNPFNIDTTIDYQISQSGLVNITIYNLKNQELITLVNEFQTSNYYSTNWDGRDKYGEFVPSGRYILEITAPQYTESITMTIIR